MKGLVISTFGDPANSNWDGLRWQDVPGPQVDQGKTLVKVQAAGLNFADVLMVRGGYPGTPPPPVIAGREFAGTIAETGEAVMGYTQWGAFAQEFAAPSHLLWPRPKHWSAEEAAAFPVNYFTAYLAYWVGGLLQPDKRTHRVLIHAVAGGVGTAAVQIGKILGLEMFGTSSSDEKLARVQQLGLQHPINYEKLDFEAAIRDMTNGEGVDVVLDMLGGEQTAKSQRCVADFGRVLLYGTVTGHSPKLDTRAMYAKTSSVHGLWLSRLAQKPEVIQPAWQQLSRWIEDRKLTPVIGHRFGIENAIEGFRLMLSRGNFGKTVFTIPR